MKSKATKQDTKYPEGHFVGMWMGIGIAMFAGIGIPISIITESYAFMGIGPALGVSVGLAIGSGIEKKYKDQGRLRSLNEKEQRLRKLAVLGGIGLLLLGLIAFAVVYFVTK